MPPLRPVLVAAECSTVFCIDKDGFDVFRDATIDEHGTLAGFGGDQPEWFYTHARNTSMTAEYRLIFMMYAKEEMLPSTAANARLSITSVKLYLADVPTVSSERENKQQPQVVADAPVSVRNPTLPSPLSWWNCCLQTSSRS